MQREIPILSMNHLTKTFKKSGFDFRKKPIVRAVKDVSLTIYQGELFALIGESGSGKSTLGKLLLKMEAPTAGDIIFLNQTDQTKVKRSPKEMQIIFQNPESAMNPFMTIFSIVMEPLKALGQEQLSSKKQVINILKKVGIDESLFQRFPSQLSGGQKQRVVIARALVTNPKFVIADEPVSSLDVSLQAQIVNVMLDLKKEFHLTYLFISHDLQLVSKIADRVAVMYQGEIVEVGETKDILENPQHEYTKTLIAAQLN